jgi:hypothetical protein
MVLANTLATTVMPAARSFGSLPVQNSSTPASAGACAGRSVRRMAPSAS